MAKKQAVWGIDIGNSSLKAIRCQESDEPGKIEALGFDFIEHSKILSQPGAEPAEILAETIQTFLSRNSTKGDRVAISVSGQNTISRFLKLPPVDPKKIPDIIKYEAKQWLPFDLDDVIWDFQPIGQAGRSDTAVPVDSEIGMFAMKREIAMKTLAPYLSNAINVDCIQSSPLSIYNFVAFDQIGVQDIEEYDPDNPPESVVVLCVGTDATDVVVTNGFSIWIRSIPIGGNVFTKALTKGLKLTFSKAEYLKRNAAAAQDPKAVFQAMRPVFNDMLSEVHRSLEYYQSLNRKAKFKKILALGNAMKMPGLRQFLTQNLGYEVTRLTHFSRLVGPEVTEAPLFKENLFSFGVSYGLAVQQLGEASLTTNLVPKEIIIDRIIREKKPWALAATSAIMLGLVLQFAGASKALETLSKGGYESAESRATTVEGFSSKMVKDTSDAVSEFKSVDTIGRNLTSNVEGRITWLEVLRAINSALPTETERIDGKKADEIERQNRVFISNIDAVTVDDLTAWFAPLKEFKKYVPDDEEVIEALSGSGGAGGGSSSGAAEGAAAEGAAASSGGAANIQQTLRTMKATERMALISGPTGKAPEGTLSRVVQLVGFHYHNPNSPDELMGGDYLRRTLLRSLKFGELVLPSTLEKQKREDSQRAKERVSMADLGISYPTLMDIPIVQHAEIVNPRVILQLFMEERKKQTRKNPGGQGGMRGASSSSGSGRGGNRDMQMVGESLLNPFSQSGDIGRTKFIQEAAKKIDAKDKVLLRRFDFVVQFAWVETPPSAREKIREEKRKETEAKQQGTAPAASPLDGEAIEIQNDENPPVDTAEPATAEPAENPTPPTPTPTPTPTSVDGEAAPEPE